MPIETFNLTIRPTADGFELQIAVITGGEQTPHPFDLACLPREREVAAFWVKQARIALHMGGS